MKLSAALAAACLLAYVLLIHDFLAVSAPIPGRILVVETWFSSRPEAMRDVDGIFARGRYELVVCVGQNSTAGGVASAEQTAARLVELGIDRNLVRVVNEAPEEVGRTFGSALALRGWLRRERPDIRSLDVATPSVHARKSRLLFTKALGPDCQVGVVSLADAGFPANRWWTTTKGWQVIVRNTAGYLQALFQSPPPATGA